MNTSATEHDTRGTASAPRGTDFTHGEPGARPLVTVILPAFNEAAILPHNFSYLCKYLDSLGGLYRWELIIVNDGSADDTGRLAEELAGSRNDVRVVHHSTNCGLGQALKTGFALSRGDYIVTYDMDLSYSPEHIGALLSKIRATGAGIVVASPYAPGGCVANVPFLRRVLSIWANRFLWLVSHRHLSTLTGMVRCYDGPFARLLSLRALGMEINPEAVYKSMVLRARIEEIPGRLEWPRATDATRKRASSMRTLHHIFQILISGFFFKPFLLFILPGLALFAFAIYVNGWMLAHFFRHYAALPEYTWFLDRASIAVSRAYQEFPHTFIVGLFSLTLSIQLISLGILAKQNKQYFEELFFMGTGILRTHHKRKGSPDGSDENR